MSVTFRDARRDEVMAVVAMLRDDSLGATREGADDVHYLAAFDTMKHEGNNHLIVGVDGDEIVATYQLTFITGLSLRAARRAQIESVRVASNRRGQGLGHAMIADAKVRAQTAGCALIQLTMNKSRTQTSAFYQQLGFTPSHVGFKLDLS